jgi:predicted transglutaminase-like protease
VGEGGGGVRGSGMIHKFESWMDKKQSCPTVEDIENRDLENLANRLKGNSDKETLTNILEWQDRNIQFWFERWPLAEILMILISISILIIISLYLLGFVTISVLVSVLLALLLLIVTITVYLFFRYRSILGENPVKKKIYKFVEVVYDTFRLSLPVGKILNYRLAVCRDYAKLTAALLFNLYPNAKIYFLTTSLLHVVILHVAAAIKIDGKYYILDQNLPVLTTDEWLVRWNRKDADVYASELIWTSEGKLVDVDFKYHEKVSLFSEKVVNTDKVTAEVAEMLKTEKISQKEKTDKEKTDFETPLKNYAIYYEDDDITKHSLMKAIKNKLESGLCGNMDKISKIEISQNKNDLIVKVYL